MRLFVTILEESADRAIEAIRGLDVDHDGVEVRAENLQSLNWTALRAATAKPLILTRRGRPFDRALAEEALAAGIDLVDVEYCTGLDLPQRHRVVLSHHDFEGMPDVEALAREMRAHGCAHNKIAVTPRNFADNARLLRILPGATVIGMGERGLYSRVLAPFKGSELLFVSRGEDHAAAPGQLTAQQAAAIYGAQRDALRADQVFAVVGNPAGRSLSPSIHNQMFRSKGVAGAYSIASVASFDEITGPFLSGEPCGLSVTVPFKVDAFRFAQRSGAVIGQNARDSQSVNTLVNLSNQGLLLADNTDVDGFTAILGEVCGKERKSVAVIGAGGTARAALVAVRRAGLRATVFNRTEARGSELASRFGVRAEPLEALMRFDGEIVIDTTPADAEVEMPSRPGMTVIRSAYGTPGILRHQNLLRDNGVQVFDGLELLGAQAFRQHELFMKVFDDRRRI